MFLVLAGHVSVVFGVFLDVLVTFRPLSENQRAFATDVSLIFLKWHFCHATMVSQLCFGSVVLLV